MAYFDVANSNDRGFTLRIHFEISEPGFVTITNIQLQSTTYSGNWFPGGTIKINGETVLTMDTMSPATHIFRVATIGEEWRDIAVADSRGTALPVSNSTKITASTTEIEVSCRMYRDSNTTQPNFSESKTVNLNSGLVYIANGSSFEAYEVWIANGTKFERYEPYVADGSKFVPCG